MLRVSLRESGGDSRELMGGGVTIRRSRVTGGVQSAESRGKGNATQMISVMDGRTASLQASGRSFTVTPKATGQNVEIEVRHEGQGVMSRTTLAGRMGEWIPVSGIDESGSASDRNVGTGGVGASAGSASSSRRYEIRVDRAN